VQQHPGLAPATCVLGEAKAEADGLNAQQRAIVMARVGDNVAARLEQGNTPSVQIREEKQTRTKRQHDLEQ